MKLFLILTLCWGAAHIITSVFRFGIVKDIPKLKDFILIDLIGTYAVMWVCAGFAYLIFFIVEM